MASLRRPDRPADPAFIPRASLARGLSRRTLLKAALAGIAMPGMAGLLSACGNASGTSPGGVKETIPRPDKPVKWPISTKNPPIKSGLMPEKGSTLRIYNYADFMSPGVIKAFEKEFGVDVRLSTFNDADEALTKVASGDLQFDIYLPSYDSLGRLVQADLLRPLNHDYIPNIANVWPAFLDPWYDQGWEYSVPYTVYTTGIGWRTDLISEDIGALDNPYDALWDPQYSGDLAVIDDFHTTMAMVLLRNGIYDLNTTSSDDIALIRTQLLDLRKQTKPRVTVSMYTDLPAGQFGLSEMWSGDIVNAQYYLPKGQSADILRFWFPSDGRGMVDNDLLVVLAQGQNPVAAHFFINYLLDDANSIENFGFTGYQPPLTSISPESLVKDGYLPDNIASATVLESYFKDGLRLLQLPAATDTEWHQVWQEFKAGG